MKKHSKTRLFKLLTFIVCIIMTVMASGINIFSVASTQTTSITCPYPLCTRKLMISGPYGEDSGVIDSAVPYLGGRTYASVYNDNSLGWEGNRELHHMHIIYCPRYDHSNSSLFRHTMTLILPKHGFTVTGYQKYNTGYHQTNYVCSYGQGISSACLSQTLCGERAYLTYEQMTSLMETFDNTGCGKTKSVLESHTWVYTDWIGKDNITHTRTKTCSLCGETQTETGSHSLTTSQWTSLNSAQHQRTKTCSVCNYVITEKANHNWVYSNYVSIDKTKHSVKRTCSVCGYTDTIEQNHNLNYGEWLKYEPSDIPAMGPDTPNPANFHYRTVNCLNCGYSGKEYDAHILIRDFEGYRPLENSEYGSVENWHYYSEHCNKCTYEIYHLFEHEYDESDNIYTDLSETQHSVKQICNECFYENEFEEDHIFITTCEPISETNHKFTQTCKCGHTKITYGEHQDNNSDCYCDDCGYLMTRFSVTIPATLSIVMDKDGKVYTPTNAAIINNSTAAVKVTYITLEHKNGWEIVNFSTNMANEKVDAKKVGLKIRQSTSNTDGYMQVIGDWDIAENESLPLPYSAVVSATSQPITGENVLDVNFIIDWRD